jgi:hypothetical protein
VNSTRARELTHIGPRGSSLRLLNISANIADEAFQDLIREHAGRAETGSSFHELKGGRLLRPR